MTDHLTLEAVLQKADVTAILHSAETLAKQDGLPAPVNGSSKLGPFTFEWNVSGSLREGSGDFVLKAPNIFGMKNVMLDYSLKASFDLDLQPYVPSPIHIPPIKIPLSYSDSVPISGDFEMNSVKDNANWVIKLVIVDVLGIPVEASAVFFQNLGDAIGNAIKEIPVVGGFIEDVVDGVIKAIGATGALNFLESILGELVNGFPIYTLPVVFSLKPQLPAPLQNVTVEGDIQIDDLSATVSSDNTNLILEGIGDITIKSQSVALALQLSGQDVMTLSLAS